MEESKIKQFKIAVLISITTSVIAILIAFFVCYKIFSTKKIETKEESTEISQNKDFDETKLKNFLDKFFKGQEFNNDWNKESLLSQFFVQKIIEDNLLNLKNELLYPQNEDDRLFEAKNINALKKYFFINKLTNVDGKTILNNITEDELIQSIREVISQIPLVKKISKIGCDLEKCDFENKIAPLEEWEIKVDGFENLNRNLNENYVWVIDKPISIKIKYTINGVDNFFEINFSGRDINEGDDSDSEKKSVLKFEFPDCKEQILYLTDPLNEYKNNNGYYFIANNESDAGLINLGELKAEGKIKEKKNFTKDFYLKLEEQLIKKYFLNEDIFNQKNYFFSLIYGNNYDNVKNFYLKLLENKKIMWNKKIYHAFEGEINKELSFEELNNLIVQGDKEFESGHKEEGIVSSLGINITFSYNLAETSFYSRVSSYWRGPNNEFTLNLRVFLDEIKFNLIF